MLRDKNWLKVKCAVCGYEQLTKSDKPICTNCKSKRMYTIPQFSGIGFKPLQKIETIPINNTSINTEDIKQNEVIPMVDTKTKPKEPVEPEDNEDSEDDDDNEFWDD